MAGLTDREQACLDRYVALLRERLGDRILRVSLFGSAARGDMWPASSPMRSDIDLLVATRDEIGAAEREALVGETYPLYLECGRQISPHFFAPGRLARPRDARERDFFATVAAEGRPVWAAPLAVRALGPADAPACDAIVAGLPDWFGLAEGVAACAEAVRTQPGLVAGEAGVVAGFVTYARPFPESAEITWMAVAAGRRGGGVGRRLVEALAAALAAEGVRALAVKTLAASAESDEYAATRAFYVAAGFVPLLELPDLWGPENPCLVLVRPLESVR